MVRFLLFFVLLLSLNSCFLFHHKTGELQTVKIPVVEKEIQDSTITRLQIGTGEVKDTSVFSLHYNFYKKPKSHWQDTINYKIAQFIHYSTYFEGDSSVSFQQISDQYCSDHLDYFYRTAKEVYDQDEYKLLWGYEVDSRITDSFPQIVQLDQSIYTFTGGAHGIYFSETHYYLKENGKRLYLKDFVKDTIAFDQIAESYFRKDMEIGEHDDLNELGFWFPDNVFTCNNNFTFDKDSIYFLYNQYEIAPYAAGTPSFSIPLSVVKHLLNMDLIK